MATQETLNQVQQLYVAYYGRPADAEGLAFWADALEANNGDTSVIINDFGNSAEFEARFGEMSNEELVNNLYQQLFGRDADDEGLAFYTGHLESGDLSLAEIASEIAGGAQDNEDGDNDLTTLNNKVAAANLYTNAAGDKHSGTQADNYAAEWLATIDANTDVDAIDIEAVIADLPESIDTSELTELLGDLQTANDNLSDALEAYAEENNLAPTAVDADTVANAAESAEAEIDNFLAAGTNATDLGVSTTAYNLIENGIDALGTQDALEDARLNVIQTEIAAEEVRLDKVLETATKDLTDADTTGSSLKSLVDGYLRAVDSIETAKAAEATASKDLNAALASFVSANAAQVDAATVSQQYVAGADNLIIEVTLADTTTATAEYDEETEEWTVAPALRGFNLDEVKADGEALVAATDSAASAEQLADVRLQSLEAYDANQVSSGALAAEAAAYATAQDNIAAFDAAREEFDELVADVEAARADAAEIATLVEAVEDAETALEDEDYTVFNMADGQVYNGTEGDDVALLGELADGETATVTDFGFAGNDALYIGDAYTLNSGKFADDGDDSVLEFFVKQVGANTVLEFEVDPFSSNENVEQSFEVVLTGINASDVSFQDGFVTVA